MPALQPDDVVDLVRSTLKKLNKGKMTDISYDYQEHVFMNQIAKKYKQKQAGGYGNQWDVLTKHNEGARNVGLYAEDVYGQVDGLVQASAPYRSTTNNFIFDVKEPALNSGDEVQILDFLKVKRQMRRTSTLEKMENDGWGKPVDSTDVLTPWGIQHSIVKNNLATGANDGFEGGNPAGFSDTYGISSVTYPRWSNWVGHYVNATKDDLGAKIKKGVYKMHFSAPLGSAAIPDLKNGPPDQQVYTTYEGRAQLEAICEGANNNIGTDITFYAGEVRVKNALVIAVPALESDTSVPYYFVNWAYMHLIVQGDWWMKEGDVTEIAGRHLVRAVHEDSMWNLANRDRRRHGVLYKL